MLGSNVSPCTLAVPLGCAPADPIRASAWIVVVTPGRFRNEMQDSECDRMRLLITALVRNNHYRVEEMRFTALLVVDEIPRRRRVTDTRGFTSQSALVAPLGRPCHFSRVHVTTDSAL